MNHADSSQPSVRYRRLFFLNHPKTNRRDPSPDASPDRLVISPQPLPECDVRHNGPPVTRTPTRALSADKQRTDRSCQSGPVSRDACMTNSSSDREHPSPGPLSVLKFGQPRTARLSRQISAATSPPVSSAVCGEGRATQHRDNHSGVV
jgi:hypothetical protein